MDVLWWLLLGGLLAGYFVLGGLDYGSQMLTPVLGRRDAGRGAVLAAVGPFVFGNEVWLVAVAGVLFGAFPRFEGVLLVGLFPLVVPLLVGLVVGNAAVQLRNRCASVRRRRLADALVSVGGAVPAVLWGMILAVLLRGVDRGANGYFVLTGADLADPLVPVAGLATLLLFLAHGACFLALGRSGALCDRAARVARVVLPVAGIVLLAVGATAALTGIAGPRPEAAGVGALGVVAALVVATLATRTGRRRTAFAATSVAAAGPVVLAGTAQFPYLVVARTGEPLTVAAGAADPATLGVLTAVAAAVLPVVAGYQLWSRRVLRGMP